MANVFKRLVKGLLLKGETSDPSDNLEGSIFHNSTDNKIKSYIGSAVREVVTNSQSQTLTNKSIDADNNTISNIDNDDIKAAAAIDADKIADGSVSNTEFQYINSLTSNAQDQIDSKEGNLVNSAGLAAAINDETGTGLVVFNNSPNIITPTGIVKGDVGLGNVDNTSDATKNSDVATLTNKTIDGDDNTLQDISLTSLKTVLADADKFISRDGSGAVISGPVKPTGAVVGDSDTQNLSNKTFTDAPLLKAGINVEDPGAGTNKITLTAPTLGGDYTLTLPVDDGTPGQVLSTDGSGVTSWATALSDPMTTAGDIIYRNGSNVTSRLPIGADGQVLKIASGLPEWGTDNSGGSGSGGSDPLNFLILHGEITDSVYDGSLSITNNTSNTEENALIYPVVNSSFRGLSEFTTNLVWLVDSITADTYIEALDGSAKHGEVLDTYELILLKKTTIDSSDAYLDVGITLTTNANATNTGGFTRIYFADTSDIAVGDIIYLKLQATKEISLVDVGVSDSFSEMTKESVEVLNTSLGGAFPSGKVSHWFLQNSSSPFTDFHGLVNLSYTGTLNQAAGHHFTYSATNFSASNYTNMSGNPYSNIHGDETNYSFSFWFYTGASGWAANKIIFMMGPQGNGAGGGNNVSVYSNTGPNKINFDFSGVGFGTFNISLSTWYHIVITHNASTNLHQSYVNGSFVNSASADLNPLTAPAGISLGGSGNGTNSIHADARFEDLQYYNKVLSAGEVTTLYNGGAGIVPDGVYNVDVRERFSLDSQSGQILKSKISVPNFVSGGIITVSKDGIIKS